MNTNGKTQQLRNSDEALWRRVKAAAALDGSTLTEWVEKAVEKRLGPEKSAKKD